MTNFAIHALLILILTSWSCFVQADDRPNIVVILADDLGYGDVQPNNPKSKIPTPGFERLAKEGINFVDAHSGSGVCTPTRYGLLCGRYCWRTSLKRGVLGGYSKPLIDADQPTIATILRKDGYHTCCVGKWHLGLGWQWNKDIPKMLNNFGIAGNPGSVSYDKPITDGPTHHGFDQCMIIPASLDMSPYVFIRNDRVAEIPNNLIDGRSFPAFYRKGEISSSFTHEGCLDRLTEEACQYIRDRAATNNPFFLYFPMPAPHKPVVPTSRFRGKSNLGPYGDFVMQVDATVGKVLKTLDDEELSENTLVVVTSDNGSFMHRYDDQEAADHVSDPSIQGYRSDHHLANGPLRGTKADVYEAGHRVPFFCRWVGQIPKASVSKKTICLTDILATSTAAAGSQFDRSASPDSFSFLNAAKGKSPDERKSVINHSSAGMFAIRNGQWKLVLGNGSGGRQKPRGKPFERPYQLFNLADDIGETRNLIEQNPQKAADMIREFESIAAGEHLKK